MKRSPCVQLVLLGSAAGLTACGTDTTPVMQQRYVSQEECHRDWGDERECTRATYGGGYFGPRYYWDPASNRPMAVHDDGSVRAITSGRAATAGSVGGEAHSAGSISRGGFGGGGHGGKGGG